jgi:hypothetical protein
MIYNKNGFVEMKEDARQSTIGDGSKMSIRQSRNRQRMIKDKKGNPKSGTLDEVCYVPVLKYNPMSLTKVFKHGWKSPWNNQQLLLKKIDNEIIFKQNIHSRK